MGGFMGFQMAGLHEAFAADLAFVGFYTSVDFLVSAEVGRSGESVSAHVTLEGLLLEFRLDVLLHVLCQMGRLSEPLQAHFTLIRLFSSVDHPVRV